MTRNSPIWGTALWRNRQTAMSDGGTRGRSRSAGLHSPPLKLLSRPAHLPSPSHPIHQPGPRQDAAVHMCTVPCWPRAAPAAASSARAAAAAAPPPPRPRPLSSMCGAGASGSCRAWFREPAEHLGQAAGERGRQLGTPLQAHLAAARLGCLRGCEHRPDTATARRRRVEAPAARAAGATPLRRVWHWPSIGIGSW